MRTTSERLSRAREALVTLALCALYAAGCVAPERSAHTGKSAEAEEAFAAGAGRAPTAETLYSMAKILESQGRDQVQEFVLTRIINENPGFQPAYSDLAQLRMRQNKVDDATEVLEAGLVHVPRDPVLLNNLGMCWMAKGNFEQSLENFTKAATLMPDDARYRANMAASLGLLGRYEESLALYKQVVPASEAHHNLGVLAEARKDMEKAAEHYRLAKDLGPHQSGSFSRWMLNLKKAFEMSSVEPAGPQ